MNRLTIEIEPEQHRQIKTLATFAGMTIKDFVLAKTLNISKSPHRSGQEKEKKKEKEEVIGEDTTAQLLASPANADRLRQAITSATPKHLVFESLKDVKHALGI
jgi:hypothetical protein